MIFAHEKIIYNVLRIQLHIETVNWYSQKNDYQYSGACCAVE